MSDEDLSNYLDKLEAYANELDEYEQTIDTFDDSVESNDAENPVEYIEDLLSTKVEDIKRWED